MQLIDFLTYVKQDFKRTDKDTEITRAYNDALVYVSTLLPIGDYKYQSWVPTVLGQTDYPIPSNCIHLIHPIRVLEGVLSSDSGYPLIHVSKAKYDQIEPNPHRANPSTGKPKFYTIFSRSILVTPIPDQPNSLTVEAYLLEINWSKRPVPLSGNTDISPLGIEWDEVLKCMTLHRVNRGIGMFDEAQYWQGLYEVREPGSGDWIPCGQLKRLLDIEKDREERHVSFVKNNKL